jgi:hypothetical protein
MKKDAIIDKSGKYRYMLTRQWGAGNNFINFILLNPSTADHQIDDPTVKSCIALTVNNGFDGFYITNLFAFRATQPSDLKKASDPFGPENEKYLKRYNKLCSITIVAWGNHGSFLGGSERVLDIFKRKPLHCLAKNKSGAPKHPLYVRRDTKPVLFQ